MTVSREGSEAVVSTKDTGIGIPAEMLPNIFEMFTQGERHFDRSRGGWVWALHSSSAWSSCTGAVSYA